MALLEPIKSLTSDTVLSSEKVCGRWYDLRSVSTSSLEVFAVVATGLFFYYVFDATFRDAVKSNRICQSY